MKILILILCILGVYASFKNCYLLKKLNNVAAMKAYIINILLFIALFLAWI